MYTYNFRPESEKRFPSIDTAWVSLAPQSQEIEQTKNCCRQLFGCVHYKAMSVSAISRAVGRSPKRGVVVKG